MRFKNLIFIILVSILVSCNQFENNNLSIYQNLWGYGIGITLTSPVGPLEFVWSTGPKSFFKPMDTHLLFSFNAGYKF